MLGIEAKNNAEPPTMAAKTDETSALYMHGVILLMNSLSWVQNLGFTTRQHSRILSVCGARAHAHEKIKGFLTKLNVFIPKMFFSRAQEKMQELNVIIPELCTPKKIVF